MLKHGLLAILIATGLGTRAGAEELAPLPELPAEFNYVGTYQLVKRVKVRSGRPFQIAIPRLSYQVYTDGITLRFYGEGSGHTSFQVYRSDGVARMRDDSLLENVPGVQARSTVGEVLRQVTLTDETMTLTKFPALSDAVEITYAVRVEEPNRLEAANTSVNP